MSDNGRLNRRIISCSASYRCPAAEFARHYRIISTGRRNSAILFGNRDIPDNFLSRAELDFCTVVGV